MPHADAHAMPKREAIWWACQCVRLAAGGKLSPQSSELIAEAEAWVVKPTDEQRRKLRKGGGGEFRSAGGFLGMRCFFSSGSLSLPNLPPVPPKEHLSAAWSATRSRCRRSAGSARAAEFYPNSSLSVSTSAAGKNRWLE